MKRKFVLINMLIPVFMLLLSSGAHADMSLDPSQSTLSFVSIKKGRVGEVHTFSDISGSLSDDGKLTIRIALDSVQTNIDIRNIRMREMLFETGMFPVAELSAHIADSVQDGQITVIDSEATLSLHGAEKTVKIKALATRVGEQLFVTSAQPVIVNAGDFGLVGGIEALRLIANLSSIPISVPVSFSLVFNLNP